LIFIKKKITLVPSCLLELHYVLIHHNGTRYSQKGSLIYIDRLSIQCGVTTKLLYLHRQDHKDKVIHG